jgi:hypothetical protein
MDMKDPSNLAGLWLQGTRMHEQEKCLHVFETVKATIQLRK